MSTTTPVNGWTIPTLSDVPNVELSFHPAFNAIDQRVIPIFSTTGLRDTAMFAPSFGQHAAVSGTGEIYWYNGSAWVSAVPRVKYKTANESVTSSTTFQDDNDFFFSMEANAIYIGELWVVMNATGSTTPDIKTQWTVPASTTGFRWRNGLASTATTDVEDKIQMETAPTSSSQSGVLGSGSTYLQETFSFDTAGTSGNATLQWAQNTSSGSATVVQAGSFMKVWKVG